MSIAEAKLIQSFAKEHDPRFRIEVVKGSGGAIIRCQRIGSESSVWYRHALDYALEGVRELGADFKADLLTWRIGVHDEDESLLSLMKAEPAPVALDVAA